MYEPLILYLVLFFPGLPLGAAGAQTFSLLAELNQLVFRAFPALALMWRLMLGDRTLAVRDRAKLSMRDLLVLLAALPGLVMLSTGVSYAASLFGGGASSQPVDAPADLAGWIVLGLSCMGTGYMEESFFRVYLFEKLRHTLQNPWLRIFFSTILFAACHIYEGPWGVLNAFSAGLFLGFLYWQLRGFHGLSCAHGMYNLFVYFAARYLGGIV